MSKSKSIVTIKRRKYRMKITNLYNHIRNVAKESGRQAARDILIEGFHYEERYKLIALNSNYIKRINCKYNTGGMSEEEYNREMDISIYIANFLAYSVTARR